MFIKFHKMHGLGNDFIVIENYLDKIELTTEQIKFLCNRKIGIGCDQLIILKYSIDADCAMVIYNADGNEVEFCGNATRCVVGLLRKKQILIQSNNKILKCELNHNLVIVNIGKANIKKEIEIDISHIDSDLKLLKGTIVNVGNPHIVFFVDHYNFDLAAIGSYIENLSIFPNRINVNFAQMIDKDNINLKVWERGVGLTMACGSGACATTIAAYRKNIVNSTIKIQFTMGHLVITIDPKGNILMEGEYCYIFNGSIKI